MARVFTPVPVEPLMAPATVRLLAAVWLVSVNVWVLPSVPSVTAELNSWFLVTFAFRVTAPPLSKVSLWLPTAPEPKV